MAKSWLVKLGHSLKQQDWAFLEKVEHRRIGLPMDKIVNLPGYDPEVMEKMVELGVIYPNRYGRYVHINRGEFDDLS